MLVVASVLAICHAARPGEPASSASDPRLGKPKDLNGYFPFKVPASKGAWARRRQEVREQVLLANGLWPMPEKLPLKPVIHGKIFRDGYTIEKVFFASYPGHYVTGNLYRPTAKAQGGKYPAILSPHGHWSNGRFFSASDAEVKSQLKQGAEKTAEGAKYPLQARCAQLARMGCVVFFYDMVGYADSKQIGHRGGFTDAEAELRQQNFMGLQTFNSIRALDFLTSLPDVDSKRIGVTGASGGGTQTFILCAIDDRPAAAFPAVMVSTAMQGGCICENCSYLRVGTGNIELAGLFAPKPLGMSGAKDWTEEIETKGLPELKSLYAVLGAPDNIMAKAYLQFGHNYNQVSRELMYNFFNKHLKLGQSGVIVEKPFIPVPVKELSVFDEKHPLPKDAVDAKGLRAYLTREADKQMKQLFPRDKARLAEFRRVAGTALRVMMGGGLPERGEVVASPPGRPAVGITVVEMTLKRKSTGEHIPARLVRKSKGNGTVIVLVHPGGADGLWTDKQLKTQEDRILDSGADILTIDAFRTGASAQAPAAAVNKNYAGYTFGYNHPLVANRVRDILAAVAAARDMGAKKIHLVGVGKAGPWVVLARGLCGDAVARTAADLNAFRFDSIKTADDEMMLPGALKYGGMPALAALAAPGELLLHNPADKDFGTWLQAAYAAAERPQSFRWQEGRESTQDVLDWLLR
ncbi:MAG: acetylxylan esterase [Planctomycetes bacterium]|nr:acetylxylan esterase [Planctomycetota bacterium]